MIQSGVIIAAVATSAFLLFSGCSSKEVQKTETTTTSSIPAYVEPTPVAETAPVANRDYTAASLGASSGGRGR